MYQTWTPTNYAPTLHDLDCAGIKIFNDWWDTYIPEYKQVLIKKIMHTYYFEQIGSETPDQFVHYINAHLERIMPYYNQLYKSELIEFNPLINYCLDVNGRTIENLLEKANTSNDKFAKAIRNFAGLTDTSSNQDTISHQSGETTKIDIGHDSYTKDGIEDSTETSDKNGSETEKTTLSKTTDTTHSKTENEDTVTTGSRNLDKTVTERPGQKSTKTMEWGATETGSENIVGMDRNASNGTKEWTEVTDDTSNTNTTNNLNETTQSNSQKDYSDTPQNNVGNEARNYLTNVTWVDDNSTHTADTTTNVAFKDDATKTHTESTTDSGTIDTTKKTDTNKSKGGTDTETTTMSGSNVTDVTEDENTNENKERTLYADSEEKETVKSDENRNLNTINHLDGSTHKEWDEKGSGDSSLDTKGTSLSDSTANVNASSTEQNKENSDVTETAVDNQVKNKESTTDTGSSTNTKGFMNVSASALLEAFRKTFINIDAMIIEELRDNFMLVY